VLVYWNFCAGDLFLCPFLWGRVSVPSVPPPPCYQCVMMVRCLFFNFMGQFDFGCCSLAQKMSFVICFLPRFREWLITHLLSAFLPCQLLFTDSSGEISSLPLPLSLVHFQQFFPFLCVLDYSLLLIAQFFLWGVSVCPGCCAGLS
jgi:hypothetical protein